MSKYKRKMVDKWRNKNRLRGFLKNRAKGKH